MKIKPVFGILVWLFDFGVLWLGFWVNAKLKPTGWIVDPLLITWMLVMVILLCLGTYFMGSGTSTTDINK